MSGIGHFPQNREILEENKRLEERQIKLEKYKAIIKQHKIEQRLQFPPLRLGTCNVKGIKYPFLAKKEVFGTIK